MKRARPAALKRKVCGEPPGGPSRYPTEPAVRGERDRSGTEGVQRGTGETDTPDSVAEIFGECRDTRREASDVATDATLAMAADRRPDIDEKRWVQGARPFARV